MPLSLFQIGVREYENIRFDASDAAFLQTIIWGIFIGALLASLLSLYQQYVPGKLVRALLGADALTKETAKTLEELGLADRPLIRRELRRGAVLKKFVLCAVENGQGTPKGAAAPTRYYIPEELKYRAAIRYEKRGNALVSLLVTTALAFAIAFALVKLTPLVLYMLDSIL